MRRLAHHWSALSLVSQILFGAFAVLLVWGLWATLGIRIAYWAWVGTWLPWHALGKPDELARLGQIGDLFGGVNALFAAFAFVGVAVAAYYQHKTFKLQSAQDVRQSFEPLFFKLLDRHHAPDKLTYSNNEHESYGLSSLDSFENVIANLRGEVGIMFGRVTHAGGVEGLALAVRHVFEPMYDRNDGELAPYFRKLYHLFKLIATSELSWEEKVRYANIARAALNKDELLLLLLNCACPQGQDFKPLVEAFGLLKHIPRRLGSGPSIEAMLADRLYSPTAVMDRTSRAKYWIAHKSERPHWANDAPN